MDQHPTSSIHVEQPNAKLIASLREVADWLEQHPGLPPFSGYLGTYPHGKQARSELTALASALGGLAEERCVAGRVHVEGRFGPVTVGAQTNVANLGVDPSPRYAPILSRGEKAA